MTMRIALCGIHEEVNTFAVETMWFATSRWPNVASEIIESDPPCVASNDPSTFTYKNKTRKVYPLDKDTVYPEPGK